MYLKACELNTKTITVSPAVSVDSVGMPQSPAGCLSPAAAEEKVALVGSSLLLLLKLQHSIAEAEWAHNITSKYRRHHATICYVSRQSL